MPDVTDEGRLKFECHGTLAEATLPVQVSHKDKSTQVSADRAMTFQPVDRISRLIRLRQFLGKRWNHFQIMRGSEARII